MKIIVAPDSFKECLSADQVCKAIRNGFKKVMPRAQILSVPMADGGEGTMSAIVQAVGGKIHTCKVSSPLGKTITAHYGLIAEEKTAIIEMAQASGLALVPPPKRNPLKTTSYGTGEIIRKALDQKFEIIILTLGGVATNDAGVGMAQALGYNFLDRNGKKIPKGAEGLKHLVCIDATGVHPRLKKTKIIALTDVRNPLCGPKGSAAVYGPQKGATPKMIPVIDSALWHLAKIIRKDLVIDVLNQPGAGAAGGAGAGAVAFLNAEIKSGVEWVIQAADLEKKMEGADLVITGEGRIDRQTAFGKTLMGVAKCAKKQNIPVIALCGQLGKGWQKVHALGIDAVFSIVPGPVSIQESIKNARFFLESTAQQIARIIQ